MGAAVAAILIRRETEVVDDFRAAGATSRETAQSYTAIGPGHSLGLKRLRDRAVIREAAPGRDRLSVDTRPRLAGRHAGNLQVKRHAVAIQSAGSIFRQGIIFGPAHHGEAAAALSGTTCLT